MHVLKFLSVEVGCALEVVDLTFRSFAILCIHKTVDIRKLNLDDEIQSVLVQVPERPSSFNGHHVKLGKADTKKWCISLMWPRPEHGAHRSTGQIVLGQTGTHQIDVESCLLAMVVDSHIQRETSILSVNKHSARRTEPTPEMS